MLVHKKIPRIHKHLKEDKEENSLITSYFKSFVTKKLNYLISFIYCVDPITDF